MQNAYTPFVPPKILSHAGKRFQFKSREAATEIKTILLIQGNQSNSLVTPSAMHPFIIILCSSVCLPLSLLCLGSSSGQPALVLCLLRHQEPKGESVLNKFLIKHLSFRWG